MTLVSSEHPRPIFMSPASVLSILCIATACSAAASIFDLIYKGCANKHFSGGSATAQQTLSSLSSALISESSTSKFFKITSSDRSIFCLFQCRGDLSPSDCSSCVARSVATWSSLCGDAVATRVQLAGCYTLYEIAGFPQVSGSKLLYKTCELADGGGGGFQKMRNAAFSSLQSGVAAEGGFYATSYQSAYAMAQCEGDLSSSDCGECVDQAVQKSQSECGGAISGQIYLDKCYISFSYYPSGVPGGSRGEGQPTGKTVAIVVGGAAALGFFVICLLFARSLMKKKDDF